MRVALIGCCAWMLAAVSATCDEGRLGPGNPPPEGRVPLTPAWALECWLWEDDHNNAEALSELVEGFEKHDIPVRTVMIDAPWSTRFNDFIFDRQRYPDPEGFIADLKARGYRVVVWMTSRVNSRNSGPSIQDSTDWYEAARDNGYLVGDGMQIPWWRGMGGFLDYTNPAAMQWWRGMQQPVFDMGIDGWKLDGAATYLIALPADQQRTHDGQPMSTRDYMNHFYREEYRHGLTQNPEFVTLSRSLDSPLPHVHPRGFSPLDASPVNWVGDNRHVWEDDNRGIQRAMYCILRSADLGYNVIGSDVGGYHGGMPIPPELYIRWAQFSTFCGLFLNGGHGERRLWMRSPEELEIIRTYSWLNTELVPYVYSHVVEAHKGGPVLMRPLRSMEVTPFDIVEQARGLWGGAGEYHYMYGDAFLVAPIYEPGNKTEITLPNGQWRYLFEDKRSLRGPTIFEREFPLDEFPVYVRDGAIIPMNVSRDYTGFGDRESEGFLTLVLYPHGESTFTLYHPDQSGILDISMTAGADTVSVAFVGDGKPHILRMRADAEPSAVRADGHSLTDPASWRYDAESGQLWVRNPRADVSRYEIQF
jgi:alpha-glucosidase (family GH31 glycosyl hydrolase)